ncbi:hypothetical protein [Streptomyces longisporus]
MAITPAPTTRNLNQHVADSRAPISQQLQRKRASRHQHTPAPGNTHAKTTGLTNAPAHHLHTALPVHPGTPDQQAL